MSQPTLTAAREMLSFIDASPSPYHACASAAALLEAAGFQHLAEGDAWESTPGKYYARRGGSLVAWLLQGHHGTTTGFRVLGAHTDSPNLRVKPHPDLGRAGCRQLAVEVYGGALVNTWLDRNLGLSGRVQLKDGDGIREQLFLISRPVLKVPQLAIHLEPENPADAGLKLNKQNHLNPIWGLGEGNARGFRDWLSAELGVEPDDLLGWEAMCHDANPSTFFGVDEDLVSAPRLDDLCAAFCSIRSLIDVADGGEELERIPFAALFDHEEVGSGSMAGAGSPLLRDFLERTVLARGGGREDYHRAIADSLCVSIDMAHATHPNFTERHDPEHTLYLNQGPVIKINANLRYATESGTEAVFQRACERANVPVQKWVMRTDMRCGSTIGPITAANLGLRTVDVGNPQLGMHSIRETCGAHDPDYLIRALREVLR